MSFLGGAECSTGRNPLAQLGKIGAEDKSLQRDRIQDGRLTPQMGGLRTMGSEIAAADRQVRSSICHQSLGEGIARERALYTDNGENS